VTEGGAPGRVPVVRPAWPTAPSTSAAVGPWPGYSYPQATGPRVARASRLSVRHLLAGLGGGLAGVVAILIVISLLTRPSPPVTCHGFSCSNRPPISQPVEEGQLYKNPQFGFTVRVLSIAGIAPAVSTTASTLTLSYTDSGQSLGDLEVSALEANGQTAEQIVDTEVDHIANGAQLAYVIPGSMIGYQPGFGAAYNFTPDSGAGQSSEDRVIVMAAIENGVAIVSVADGPYQQFTQSWPDGQLSIADLLVAVLGDPVLNTVAWPGQPSQ
jgi:hypothetical protein